MGYQMMGAVLIVAACGGYGLLMAVSYRQRERELEGLMRALKEMENQLSYQLPPLPELCCQAGKQAGGLVGRVFATLARELEQQSAPSVSGCMAAALCQNGEIPLPLKRILSQLGKSLGRFDLPGQLKGLEAAGESCRYQLEQLHCGREPRLRSYRTLSLCAGAALVIILL